MEYWKISDFTQKIGDLHMNTVDRWFKKLEEQQIHYISRINGERIYDELDLKVALFIKERRDEKWALEAIFNILPFQLELRPFPEDKKINSNTQVLDIKSLKKQLTNEIKAEITKEIQGQFHLQNQHLEEWTKQRDQQLMQTLREIQETKKLITSTQEEKKKNFLSKLFKK